MIIIAGTLDLVDPNGRDALVEAAIEYQRATREEEPGCEAYCFGADPVVPGRIQIYELWTDEASLAAHFVHPNYLNMRTLLNGAGLAKAATAKFRCDLSEPVYDATRTPRADFFTAK
jgi:quinol monooxygenase YgiN